VAVGRLLAALVLLGSSEARAQSATVPVQRAEISARPHAFVDIGIGGLSLPYKQLCLPTESRCARSDYTLLGSLRYALRFSTRWAFGAGVSLGFRPISDEATVESPRGNIERIHSRNYLLMGGLLRYYALRQEGFEAWVGSNAGIIVVSDRYELKDKGTAIINPRSTTLATQGPMVGLGAGLDWSLNPSWAIGGWTTQMVWFLPKEPVCGATLECATVSGASYSLELGLSLTYRTRI
jgi:hypothetical protein